MNSIKSLESGVTNDQFMPLTARRSEYCNHGFSPPSPELLRATLTARNELPKQFQAWARLSAAPPFQSEPNWPDRLALSRSTTSWDPVFSKSTNRLIQEPRYVSGSALACGNLRADVTDSFGRLLSAKMDRNTVQCNNKCNENLLVEQLRMLTKQ